MSEDREYRQTPFAPPPGALDLLLVRHGASMPWMPGRDFTLRDGHGDPELSPEGIEQAEKVAQRLATEGVDAIYVTTLRRTLQTAEPLVRRTGIEPRVEADLREVFLGEWEGGVFRQKVVEADPVAVRMFQLESWAVIPGAEDDGEFAARVREGFLAQARDDPARWLVVDGQEDARALTDRIVASVRSMLGDPPVPVS